MARRIVQTVVDGVVTERRYMALQQELYLDFATLLQRYFKEATGGTYPANIDAWRTAFNPEQVLVKWLKAKGYTDAQIAAIPPVLRDCFRFFFEIATTAVVVGHGKQPGMPDEIAQFEEPIP